MGTKPHVSLQLSPETRSWSYPQFYVGAGNIMSDFCHLFILGWSRSNELAIVHQYSAVCIVCALLI